MVHFILVTSNQLQPMQIPATGEDCIFILLCKINLTEEMVLELHLLIKNNSLMQEEQSNTEIFGKEGCPVFSLTLLELVVFLYTTTLDLVVQLVWGSNRL